MDGPLRARFERERARRVIFMQELETYWLTSSLRAGEEGGNITLEDFIDAHDSLLHGLPSAQIHALPALAQGQFMSDFRRILTLAHVHVDNNFTDVSALNWYLDRLDLLDEERLRPGWDTYFMVRLIHHTHVTNADTDPNCIDFSVFGVRTLKLHETTSRGFACEIEANSVDRL